MYFYAKNVKKTHRKIKGKEHELDYIYNIDTIICEKHSSKASSFCATCNFYVCENCLINEHKSHKIKEEDENDNLKLNNLKKLYNILEEGKKAKVQIVQKIDDHQNILNLLKDDLKLIEDFKSLGKILYFSSKKLKAGKFKEHIINSMIEFINSKGIISIL